MKTIDFESWNRKEHYEYFSQMDDPFFGIVTEIECTKAFNDAKEHGHSFFASYLHKSTVAVNNVDEMRYRIVGGNVVVYDRIHAGATLGRNDGTFGFAFMHYSPDFEVFKKELDKEIDNVQRTPGLHVNEEAKRIDQIHHSTIPWKSFTGLTHAKSFGTEDSIPKITFGKAFHRSGKMFMPVSVDVHHGLADGFHVARYLDEFQNLMNA